MQNIWLLSMLFAVSVYAHAEPVLQKVIDGDTVIILDQGKTYHLRLLDIDAPESQQTYGKQSKRNLVELCEGKIAVHPTGTDPYGRTLGHLYCNHTDASQYQVAQGMAWFNSRYSSRTELVSLQQQAQQHALGLWQQANPTPPWVWRKHFGQHYRHSE